MVSGSEVLLEIYNENYDMEEFFMELVNQFFFLFYGNCSCVKKYQKIYFYLKVKFKKCKICWGCIFVGLFVFLVCVGFGMIFMFLKGYLNVDLIKFVNVKAV